MAPRQGITTTVKPKSSARRGAAYFDMSGPGEFIAAAVLFALMLVIRVTHIMRYAFDSDESQHLHVIWGWARGFVQYRDLFDNHMPLFQLLFAPIFGLIGDRATILYVLRFIMLPLYFVAAWCTYQIGTSLFSKRAGVWAMILIGLYSGYHFVSIEFRTDNLWAPLWLLCVTVLVTGPLTVRRALVGGLLLGLCFGVSMKSALFLYSIALAAPATLFLVGRRKLGYSWSYLTRYVTAFLVSAATVPATIMAFFALKGMWRDFRYCVFDFNFLAFGRPESPLSYRGHPAPAVIKVIIALFIIVYVVWSVTRTSGNTALAFRRRFVLIVCASYFLALKTFWPVTSYDDRPSFYPLVAVLCSAALLAASDALLNLKWNQGRILRRLPLPAVVALAEIIILVGMQPVWKDRTKPETDLLRNVLTLLQPGDYVLDCKGETVFRQRCVRAVFETFTRSAIQRGLIADDGPQRCVETRTCVVATPMIKRFPPETRRFVKRNYLPVTKNLRVAGEELRPSSTNPGRYEFEVIIPAAYEIISPIEIVSGVLDGTPYNGARFLAAGRHAFESTSPCRDLVVLWEQAAARHFTPFKHHS